MGSLLPLLVNSDEVRLLADLLPKLKSFEQHKYLDAVINYTITDFLPPQTVDYRDAPALSSKVISGAANLIHVLCRQTESLKNYLILLLTRPTIPSLNGSLAARRAIMAAVAQHDGNCPRLILVNS